MEISVKYFASLREIMGTAAITLEVDESTSVDHLWHKLASSSQVEMDNVMMTVNHEYVKAGHQLQAGDEVAFFPPVTGG